MSPVVTVIIPTFNRCPLVGAAIESVLSQSYDDFELIVVDDGSTDGTAAELAKFGSRLRLFCQANHGVSSARNFAAREARGHYLAFLDSDDVWHPKKLEIQTYFMERNPSIQICQTEEIWIRNGTRVNPKSRHRKPSGDIFTPSLELCLVSPSAVMLTRELFNQVGGFDERFPVCEDYDLWLRIAINHLVPLIVDPLVIKRGGHADQLSRSVWGLDRYRVMALQKLLRSKLGGSQREAAVRVLRRKVEVLAAGARKRGKVQDAVSYETILAEFDQGRPVGNGDSRIRDGQGNSAGDVGALA